MDPNAQEKAIDLWQQTCRHINETSGLSSISFNTWIEPLKPISLTAFHIVLGVPDSYFGNFLKENMGDLIQSSLTSVTGKPDFVFKITVIDEHKETQPETTHAPIENASIMDDEEEIPEIYEPDGCDPAYTFDKFVVGNENRIAYFAALKAAEKPGTYNPLFIYGGTSLGKTHLLQAIANEYCKTHQRNTAKYITCEQMMNDYTDAIRAGSSYNTDAHQEFRNRYRGVDILLVDDIHFLGKTVGLQEVFFNIFNTLHHDRRQIVLASDRPPAQINGLADRLVSRFESGLIAEIIPPSYETRLAVVKKYREMYGSRVPDDVLEFLASRITANMRRLKGAMTRIAVYETFHNGETPNVGKVEEMLSDLLATERTSRRVAVEEIQRKVSEHFDIRLQDLLGPRRTKQLAIPRQIAMYLSRRLTDLSYPDIASAFGGKNHATVIHAYKKIESEIERDPDLRVAVTVLERLLKD